VISSLSVPPSPRGVCPVVVLLLGACTRAGFQPAAGLDGGGESPNCRILALTVANDLSDGEVDFGGDLLPQGELHPYSDPAGLYMGSWKSVTGSGRTWGFFRFELTQPISVHAAVSEATLTLRGIASPEANAGWNQTPHALQIFAENSPDAPPATGGLPSLTANRVRWPAAGGLSWNTAGDNSVDIAPVLQRLVDTYGRLYSGAQVQLWLSGDYAEVATTDSSQAGASPARLAIRTCK
jgi:hypothetical protein